MARSTAPTIVLVEAEQALGEHLSRLLERDGYNTVIARTARDAYNMVLQNPPDTVIVDVSLPDADGHELCRRFRQNPKTFDLPILLLTKSSDAASKIAVIEAGADDHLTRPFHPDALMYRVKSILVRSNIAGPELMGGGTRGRIIAFFSCKGGTGNTTLAVNTALALQLRGAGRIALYDTAFSFGDVGVHLDLRSNESLLDVIKQLDELDPSAIEPLLTTHESGLRVLLAPPSPEMSETITAQHVELMLKYLAQLYDYVIVDCPTNYDDRTLSVLEHADDIMLITTPEVSAIRNTSNFIDLALRLKIPLKKIHVVLNRADSNAHIGVAEIGRILRHSIEFRVLSSGRALVRSLTRGLPLVLEQEQHPFAQQIYWIADELLGRPHATAEPRPTSPKLLTKLAPRESVAASSDSAPTPATQPTTPPARRSRLQAIWDTFWRWLTDAPTRVS